MTPTSTAAALSPSVSRPARMHPAAAKLLAFGLWLGASALIGWGDFYLFNRNNIQPAGYHPDEPGKVMQIVHDERNHRHPQLMLEATLLWLHWHDLPSTDPDAVLTAGRAVSAAMTAGAIVLMAWTGLAAAGWAGFVCVAIIVGLCPELFAHARHFKEDPTLLFGIAVVLCVGAVLCARRWHWTTMIVLSGLLGAACGVAASGKYSGAIMLAPALLLIVAKSIGRWWLMLCLPPLLLATATLTWVQINHRAMADWPAFVAGFRSEKEHSLTGHDGVMLATPTFYFADNLIEQAMPYIPWLAAIAPLAMLLQRRGAAVGAFLLLFALLYLAALSFSTIPFYRYVLPVTMALYALAGLAIAWLVRATDLPVRWQAALLVLPLVAIAYAQGRRCEDFDRQFAHDSRDALAAWARQTFNHHTRVVADGYTNLGGGFIPDNVPGRIDRRRFAAQAGSVQSLRDNGVQYIAIADRSYERFLDPHIINDDPNEPGIRRFEQMRQFYSDLIFNYPIAWQYRAEHSMHVLANPDITVFRIDRHEPRP